MAFDKYNRSKFYEKNNINGILENDLISVKINNFKFTRPRTFYTIVEEDLKRPDIISFKNFQTTSFWWIIFRLNDIVDPFNELEIGDVIQIPDRGDIEDFISSV